MKLKGKVHKYGANLDTDAIIPARYLNLSEAAELREHCMEDVDPQFLTRVEPGDIIVADSNFGCGSSREHAPVAIKAAGISCIIAKSFARIFFRNSINIGLPLLESGVVRRLAVTHVVGAVAGGGIVGHGGFPDGRSRLGLMAWGGKGPEPGRIYP